jgi:hypothetical protein
MAGKNPPFDEESGRLELCRRLNQVLGGILPEDRVNHWPSFPIAELGDPAKLESFLAVLKWAIGEVKDRPV